MFAQAMPRIGSRSASGTLRIWKMPACATSTRKQVLSPAFAVTVMVTTDS